jgi:hypothetical protein
MLDRSNRPFLRKRRIESTRSATPLKCQDMLNDVRFLIVRFFNNEAIVLDHWCISRVRNLSRSHRTSNDEEKQ